MNILHGRLKRSMACVGGNLMQVQVRPRQVCQPQVPRRVSGQLWEKATIGNPFDNLGPHDQGKWLTEVAVGFREKQGATRCAQFPPMKKVALQRTTSTLSI